jgi:hypothetical protein
VEIVTKKPRNGRTHNHSQIVFFKNDPKTTTNDNKKNGKYKLKINVLAARKKGGCKTFGTLTFYSNLLTLKPRLLSITGETTFIYLIQIQ